jgi:activator of HSP90 ATPase
MKEFKKYYKLNVSPADIYNALTNPVMIEIWTGEHAEMNTNPGSEFSLWNGAIVGKNISFEKDKEITQHWYFGEDIESEVTIRLHPQNEGTNIEIHQTNIPDEAYNNIIEGWEEDYIGNLRELFT